MSLVIGFKQYALSRFDGKVISFLLHNERNALMIRFKTVREPNHSSPIQMCDNQEGIRSHDPLIMREPTVR